MFLNGALSTGFWKSFIARTTSAPSMSMPSVLPNTVTTKSTPTDSPTLPGVVGTAELGHGHDGSQHCPAHTSSAIGARKGTSFSLGSPSSPPAAAIPGATGSQRVDPTILAASAASPGALLEKHILRPHTRSTESETLGKGAAVWGLTSRLEIQLQASLRCSRVCVWGIESGVLKPREFSSLSPC